jgi:hypothetical protein
MKRVFLVSLAFCLTLLHHFLTIGYSASYLSVGSLFTLCK